MMAYEIVWNCLVQTNSMPECQEGKTSMSVVRALIHVKQLASSWDREKENLPQRQSILSLPSPIQHLAKNIKVTHHHRLPSALVSAVISKGESCGLDVSSLLNHCSKQCFAKQTMHCWMMAQGGISLAVCPMEGFDMQACWWIITGRTLHLVWFI